MILLQISPRHLVCYRRSSRYSKIERQMIVRLVSSIGVAHCFVVFAETMSLENMNKVGCERAQNMCR